MLQFVGLVKSVGEKNIMLGDYVPVVLASKPWSDELKAECFLRGPHK
jgi:hypothetical protein